MYEVRATTISSSTKTDNITTVSYTHLIGVSTGKMAQMESITNNLCEEGKEAFKNGDINFTTAYETSRLPVEKQKEVIESGEMLSGEVRQMVEQERQKKEPTAAAVKKFYEAHAKKYDEDRSKLKELCIEHMGRSHNGGNSGGVSYVCSLSLIHI